MELRTVVLGIFLLCLTGTAAELLFLEHVTGVSQLIPLVLMVMSLLVLAWHALERRSASLRAFQITMLLVVASGLLGVYFHYGANAEFELEGDPELAGMALLSKALAGPAPSLAPGTMVQLGLLGLAYTLRHPRLAER